MVLTSIEIIAAVFVLLGIIKIFTVSVNRRVWYDKVTKPVYGSPNASRAIFGILTIVVLYFLLQELSIVQIFAVIAFYSLLIGYGFMEYSKEVIEMIKKIYNKRFTMGLWIYTIVFLLLFLWVLYEIFLI